VVVPKRLLSPFIEKIYKKEGKKEYASNSTATVASIFREEYGGTHTCTWTRGILQRDFNEIERW
jgi:hypothetical protein